MASRATTQGWSEAGRCCLGRIFEGGEEREGLDGFTQPHLVGEDAAELVAMQVVEPRGAEFLVGAQ